MAAIAAIARVTDLPITADLENGYEQDDSKLITLIKDLLSLGVVGINVEDSHNGVLIEPLSQAHRIEIVRSAAESVGVDLFINARVDTAFYGSPDNVQRDSECLERAMTYIAASADGVFVPGVVDLPTVKTMATALPVPLNTMVGPGSPTVAELLGAGAGRITTGVAGALAAYARIETAALELLRHGTYDELSPAQDFALFNASMR